MNRRMVFHTVGQIVLLEAALLLLPTVTAICYRENSVIFFLFTAALCALCGLVLMAISRPKDRTIFAKEGFVITTLAWLSLSALGALPFFLSGQIPHYIDAFFETVSGFTTTGASILENIEALDRGMLFWRSFTHWVGGMGVLVFLAAFLSGLSDRSIHILRAEMPGPTVGKLLPKTRDTAKILYLIYVVMTAVQVVLLKISGMSLYDSLVHSFGTAGTGGFGVYLDSAASFTPLQQWIIAVFMVLFGINFNLYYLLLIGKIRAVFRSTELWWYLGIIAFSTALIALDLRDAFSSAGEILRHSAFQVSSVITTTGFTTLDFNALPTLSQTVLLLLMFLGACGGSTGGGFKVSRFVLLCKHCGKEIRHMLHPRAVTSLRFEGKSVEKETSHAVLVYSAAYTLCFFATFLLLSFDRFDVITNFSAAASCFNNIGPALGEAFQGYFGYSSFSKLLLSLAMLLGRLEIWPILLTFSPAVWLSRSKQKGTL